MEKELEIEYDVVDFGGEVEWFKSPSGKFIVDPQYLERFINTPIK